MKTPDIDTAVRLDLRRGLALDAEGRVRRNVTEGPLSWARQIPATLTHRSPASEQIREVLLKRTSYGGTR